MPHRRTPRGYAKNLLQKEAFYDAKTKESINTLTVDALFFAVEAVFPKAKLEMVFPEGLTEEICIPGLVLRDVHGEGALQEVCVPERELIADTFGGSIIQ